MSDDYKINVKKATEAFDANTWNKWDNRIGFHLKMVGNLISKKLSQILFGLSSQDRCAIVLQLVEENYGDDLSNFPTSNIVHQLYQPFHEKLEKPCKALVLCVEDYMINCLEYIPETVLPTEASYKLPLSQKLIKTIKDVAGKSKAKCMKFAKQMLKMVEKDFTVNPHYVTTFTDLKTKESV